MSTLNYNVGDDPDSGDSGATYDGKIGGTLAELANRSGRIQCTGTIVSPANGDYTFILKSRYGFQVDDATFKADAGTLTANLKIDSTSVTSLSAVAVTSAEATTTPTGSRTATAGQALILTLSSVSGVGKLYFNIWLDRTEAGTV